MPRSAWERLTDGRCNDFQHEVKKKKKKPKTAAQLKRAACNLRKQDKAASKFAVAVTSRQASYKASEAWFNREATDTKGFFDPKKAKATA